MANTLPGAHVEGNTGSRRAPDLWQFASCYRVVDLLDLAAFAAKTRAHLRDGEGKHQPISSDRTPPESPGTTRPRAGNPSPVSTPASLGRMGDSCDMSSAVPSYSNRQPGSYF